MLLGLGNDSEMTPAELLKLLLGDSQEEKPVYEPETEVEKQVYDRLMRRYEHFMGHLENLSTDGIQALMMSQQEYLVALRGDDAIKTAEKYAEYESIREAWRKSLAHLLVLVDHVADVGTPEPGHLTVGDVVTAKIDITRGMLLQRELKEDRVRIPAGTTGRIVSVSPDEDDTLSVNVRFDNNSDGWVQPDWIS